MNESEVWQVRMSVKFVPGDWSLGFTLWPKFKTLDLKPFPTVRFYFWLVKSKPRPLWDTFIEFWCVIATVNIIALVVAALITVISN